ncbi:MAG TPA: HAD-IA family hydrolase [Vicinamibacterales bacterium]
MTPHGLTLLVFDLDGTLIDSRRDLADAANALIVERGGTPLAVDAVTAMVGEGAALLVRRALAAANLRCEDPDAALARFLALYDERLLAHTVLYDGTREMLESLAARVPLAVLTNKPQRPTERILEGLGIRRCFTWVVGGDSVFGRKPDPAGLNHLIATAGSTRGDTVMVGDSAIDLRTARAAGVRCCLVRYGFGFPTAEREPHGDEFIAEAAADLLRLTSG